jgi:hypothetical protein
MPFENDNDGYPQFHDGIAEGLAIYLHECAPKIWSHIPDIAQQFPPPAGYAPRVASNNPFRMPEAATTQSSRLTLEDVRKLYEAMAFAMWRYKVTMNVHVTIIWSMMNIEPQRGAKILGKYLHEAKKWAAVGLEPHEKRRRMRLGWRLHYVFVHENVPGRGFHSHVLMNIEKDYRDEFEAWSRKCLERLTRHHVRLDALHLTWGYAKTESEQIEQSWHWFRYLAKEYDDCRSCTFQDKDGGSRQVPFRDVLKLWPVRPAIDIPPMDRCKASHSIGTKAQEAEGFRSLFWSCKTDQPYNEHFGGWKLQQFVKALEQGMQPRFSLR